VTALVCHPQTPSAAVSGVGVRIVRTRASLALEYAIEGRIEELRIPAPRSPRIGRELWKHTCCEVLVGRSGSPAYLEFNFSPSGEWAGYAFERYRNGAPFDASDPKIGVRSSPARLELDASIQVQPGKLVLALSAVIEHLDGRISYWALRHPPGKPDFHHPQGFALELD